MTIDITPKTILRMATGFEFDGDKTTATTLRALSSALTKAEHLLKMQEIATEIAIVAWDQTVNDLTTSQAETAAAYEAVTVKPLDWASNQWNWLSYHFPYEIRCEGGIGYLVDYGGYTLDGKQGGPHDTFDEARCAAQADHDTRILTAIDTPADSKAALDRMIAEARADGMQKAAEIATQKMDPRDSEYAQGWDECAEFIHIAILAAIPKGKDHE